MHAQSRRLLLQPDCDFGDDLLGDGISRGFTAIDHPHHFRDETGRGIGWCFGHCEEASFRPTPNFAQSRETLRSRVI